MSHKSKRKKERMKKRQEEREIVAEKRIPDSGESLEDITQAVQERTEDAPVSTADTEDAQKTTVEHAPEKKMLPEQNKESQHVQKTVHQHGPHCVMRKKIQNVTALCIVLAGFVVGALFVDVAQLVAQRGFSAHGLDAAQVITYGDATWVRHNEPRVVVDVVVSETCAEACEVTSDLLLELRRFIPTLEAHRVNVSTPEGRFYKEQHDITAVPALLFDKSLKDTAFYREAKIMFVEGSGDMYHLDLDSLDVATVPVNDGGENADVVEREEDGAAEEMVL